MPLLDHFSILAPYYEGFIPLTRPNVFLQYLDLPVKGALLDAGGGTGRVSQALRGYASQVVLVDLSFGMLKQANMKTGLRVVGAGTERLPFMDEAFERVLMVDALHHVINQAATCAELWRVVKKGGKVVIVEPDVRQIRVKLVAVMEKIALMRSHFLTPAHILSLFSFQDASGQIEIDEYNAWIIIDKLQI
jgi:ubiquinone/menaquinone biosynthesis C-methylase UbiE